MEITDDLNRAVEVLRKGGIIAHPADTCFGFATDLQNREAVLKLQQIKGREERKPMSIMLPSFMKPQLHDYAVCDDFSSVVCEKLFPGPVTIVLPKGPKVPDYFFPELHTIGIRMPYDILTDKLLTKFKSPLVTTSANLSGQPVSCSVKEVMDIFEDQAEEPDLFLLGEIENHCMPSTVLEVSNDSVKILREGPLKKEQIEAILGIDL